MNAVISFFNCDDDDASTNQKVVDDLHDNMRDMSCLEHFPTNIKWMLEKRTWERPRRFGKMAVYPACTLHDLIHKPYPEGVGISFDTVERLIAGHESVMLLWTEATKRPAGGANNPHGCKGKPEGEAINVNNVNGDLPERPQGNTAEAGLRRLAAAATPIIDTATGEIIRDADPKAAELLERVKAKDISVNAACIEMGWRKKTIVVPDNVEALSDQAAKRWGALASIRRLLTKLTYDERCQVRFWLDELDAANK